MEIDANGHAGLVFASGSAGSKLLGLAVGNADGDGVTLNAGSITVDLNYIGLNLAGSAFGKPATASTYRRSRRTTESASMRLERRVPSQT